MKYMSFDIAQLPQDFRDEVSSRLNETLSNTMPYDFRDKVIRAIAERRFLDCLVVANTPSRFPLMEGLFGENIDVLLELSRRNIPIRTNLDYHVALACEYYCAFFPEYIRILNEKKQSSLGIEHYLRVLEWSYAGMSQTWPEYSVFATKAAAIISAFERTYQDISHMTLDFSSKQEEPSHSLQ